MFIECAKVFVRSSTIEARYQEVLKALYPAIVIPLIHSFLINLDTGAGFQIGDVTFDKGGLHRSRSFGTIQKGFLETWISLAGGSSVQERAQRYQHLSWSEFGGHSFGSGYIHIFRNREPWTKFALRDTWNAVCLGPLFDFLYEDNRLGSLVNG